MNRRINRKILHWLLFTAVVIFLVSGFGISHFRVVETITFGLLTKNIAFRVHEAMWIPFVILLALHLTLTMRRRRPKLPDNGIENG